MSNTLTVYIDSIAPFPLHFTYSNGGAVVFTVFLLLISKIMRTECLLYKESQSLNKRGNPSLIFQLLYPSNVFRHY